MAWTTPTDRSTGFLVTAAVYNADIIDNLAYLHGDAGLITLVNALTNGPTASGSLANAGAHLDNSVGRLTTVGASLANTWLIAGKTGDANAAFTSDHSGRMDWGVGAGSATDTTLSRAAAAELVVNGKLLEGFLASSGTVPTTWTPALGSGLYQRFNVTAGGAATLTIGAPTAAPSASQSSLLVLKIANTGGGTVTLTWNAVFQSLGTTVLPASVANGGTSVCLFAWDGSTSKWSLLSVN